MTEAENPYIPVPEGNGQMRPVKSQQGNSQNLMRRLLGCRGLLVTGGLGVAVGTTGFAAVGTKMTPAEQSEFMVRILAIVVLSAITTYWLLRDREKKPGE